MTRVREIVGTLALLSIPALFFAGSYYDRPRGMRALFLEVAYQRLSYLYAADCPSSSSTVPRLGSTIK